MKFGLTVECRNPEQWYRPSAHVYGEILEACASIEKLGFDAVEFSEHHFTDDGFLPSPLIMASAVAARTRHLRLVTNVALLPFYHPVRLAEDAAVIDNLSDGRFELGLGIGYRAEEFSGYGVNFQQRGEMTDEALPIIRKLLAGERISFNGKYFHLDQAKIPPLPVQNHPTIWVGGTGPAGIRRAALLGDGYTGAAGDRASYSQYVEELKLAGKSEAQGRLKHFLPATLCVSHDPERLFARLAPHVMYYLNVYAQWGSGGKNIRFDPIATVDQLKAAGALMVLTPEQATSTIEAMSAGMPVELLSFPLVPPGVPIHEMRDSLELFASQVMPHFTVKRESAP